MDAGANANCKAPRAGICSPLMDMLPVIRAVDGLPPILDGLLQLSTGLGTAVNYRVRGTCAGRHVFVAWHEPCQRNAAQACNLRTCKNHIPYVSFAMLMIPALHQWNLPRILGGATRTQNASHPGYACGSAGGPKTCRSGGVTSKCQIRSLLLNALGATCTCKRSSPKGDFRTNIFNAGKIRQ